jgi:hypothetical protein
VSLGAVTFYRRTVNDEGPETAIKLPRKPRRSAIYEADPYLIEGGHRSVARHVMNAAQPWPKLRQDLLYQHFLVIHLCKLVYLINHQALAIHIEPVSLAKSA